MEAKTFVMPLAVIGAVVLVYVLLKRSNPASVILAQTGTQANPASVGGNALPTQSQINTQATTPVQPGTVQQIPATASSGVPEWAGQPQQTFDVNDSFRQNVTALAPDAGSRTAFYAPAQARTSNVVPQPASQPRASKPSLPIGPPPAPAISGSSCGCGGGCQSCTTKCSTFNSRYSDGRGGCMAMDRRRQIRAATRINPKIWENMQYQLESSGNYDFFHGFQQEVFFMQRNNPQTEAHIEPAAPALQHTGNTQY